MQESMGRTATPAGRRGIVVLAVGLLVGGTVLAGVVLTRRNDAKAPAQPAAAAQDDGNPFRLAGRPDPEDANQAPPPPPEVLKAEMAKVLETVEQLDQTVFAKEVEAQKYEEYFIRLWDTFRAAEDKFAVLEGAAFQTLAYGTPAATSEHDWGVQVTKFDGAGRSVDAAGWKALIAGLREAGYRATELEFHQSSFDHEPGKPAHSTVSTLVHLVNDKASSRQVVRTKLAVEWADEAGPDGVFVPRMIAVTDLSVAQRTGDAAFTPVALPGGTERGLKLPPVAEFVLAYDLDGDGLSEIIVPGANLLLRNQGNWQFAQEQILPATHGMDAAVIGDFNGDGLPDMLCRKGDELYMVLGVQGGRFSTTPPSQAARLSFPTAAVIAMSAGDIDGDGDLDAWFGQYKPPYAKGQMPTPYYDANDGYASALLINDGTGQFTDGTEAAGLAGKRHRRVNAGSFVDLDGDRDLDLLVNSDFAGLDVFYNDGKGRFADVTDRVIDERHNFGMGHTFADFNGDGLLDMYTIGMSSTTARRLTAMGAGREEFPEHQAKRPQMGYGNRLFLATAAAATGNSAGSTPAAFVQPKYRDDVARTGWSWGATSPDFDNDGDPDLYIANGNISGTTCRDYCTTYWRRDIYLGNSKSDPVLQNLFYEHGMGGQESWNGFEHNVLFMNEGGKGFVNVAHLMGVAFEFDSRNVIGDDFDGDGKVDILVVEKQLTQQARYLHVLKNDWPSQHNWVGVRLAESRPGFSPLGAAVRVHTADGVRVGRVVAGDSLQSQHAAFKHFGIGAQAQVRAIEVIWPNGETTRVENPAVNKWHNLRAASDNTASAAAAR
jgi:hypothetical protein